MCSGDVSERMNKTIELLKEQFLSIHSGRVNSGQFEKVMVDCEGASVPLVSLASIRVLNANTIVVTPYDSALLSQIDRALRNVPNIGTPGNDGGCIKIVMPQLTEARRHEYVKQARVKAEEARVSARNIRRKARASLDAMGLAKDEIVRREKELDKLTKDVISVVDDLLRHKESELLRL